jgi:hypothetical protein
MAISIVNIRLHGANALIVFPCSECECWYRITRFVVKSFSITHEFMFMAMGKHGHAAVRL